MGKLSRTNRGRARPSSLPLLAPATAAALALLLAPAARADWKFTPKIELRQTYTDNVALASSDKARGQWVTDIAPGFMVANNGPRLKLKADYQLHYYAFSDRQAGGTNRTQRSLRADANAKLIDDFLYADASASIGQQSISAFGQQINDNGYSSANRAEVRTYRVSPYLVHKFGGTASTQVRYTHDSVDSGNNGLGNSQSDTLLFNLASGTNFRRFGWALQYLRQELNDSIAEDTSVETASANVRYRLSPTFTVTANGGYDKYDYVSMGGETRGASWAGGFTWTPSSRTSVRASAGRRYFGPSRMLAASHRSHRTVWSVNYDDAITTTRGQFLLPTTIDTATTLDALFVPSFPDPVLRAQAIEAYISATGMPRTTTTSTNYFSNRYILQKQLRASAAFKSARSMLVLTIYDTRRSALSALEPDSGLLDPNLYALNDNTRQRGGNVMLNYQLTSRSAASVALTAFRTESISAGFTNDNKALRFGMSRQFSPKTKGAVELRHVRGTTGLQSGSDYRENAVTASLSMQL